MSHDSLFFPQQRVLLQRSRYLKAAVAQTLLFDDDCFYYRSWRNSVVIVFGTVSSYVT